MSNSGEYVLPTIKLALDIEPDDDEFDVVLLLYINSSFSRLTQLGIGPPTGFSVANDTTAWSEYTPIDKPCYAMLKEFLVLSVRCMFDPPATTHVSTAFKERITELEWLLREQAWVDGA